MNAGEATRSVCWARVVGEEGAANVVLFVEVLGVPEALEREARRAGEEVMVSGGEEVAFLG